MFELENGLEDLFCSGINRMMIVMCFDDAPKEIQELSTHGGDEDEIIIIDREAFEKEERSGWGWFSSLSEKLQRGIHDAEWIDTTIDGIEVKVMITSH